MAKPPSPQREVICYRCGHRIAIGARTMSTSCPGCHKPVIVEDIVVKGYKGVFNVETCGKLIVPKKGRVVAQKKIIAHGGIEVEGVCECKEAITGGHVHLGKKAEWRGNLNAPSLSVEAGAKIRDAYMKIPDNPIEGLSKTNGGES